MTEKVKLTQEQAWMIENHRGSFERLMRKHHTKNCPTYIDELTTQQVVDAYFGGYEIEETFEVGDWVMNTSINKSHELKEELCVKINANRGYYKHLRHATPEEIAEEKQRRWWAKHGRNVFEFKKGDLIVHRKIVTGVTEVIGDLLWVEMNASVGTITKENYDQIKVIYFAEDLKYLGESK